MDFNFIVSISSHLGWCSSNPSDHGRVDSLEFSSALFLALSQIYKGQRCSQFLSDLLSLYPRDAVILMILFL